MTRAKYKRKRKPPRRLSPLQQVIVAREILSGKPQKQIAVDWKVSRSHITRILHRYLQYRLEWRPGMEPQIKERA